MSLEPTQSEERYLHPARHGDLDEIQAEDAYTAWQRDEGVKVIKDHVIENINDLELAPWPRRGVNGAILNLDGTQGLIDAHIIEIAPASESNPERHVYEEIVYVLSGRGNCAVWTNENAKQNFEWGAGSLFAIPLNAWSQQFNGSGQEPARLLSITNLPSMLKTFRNRDFIFNNNFLFMDRFDGADGYFSNKGKLWHRGMNHVWETNLVPDVRTQTLHANGDPGVGVLDEELALAQNSMGAYIAEVVRGTYIKARHLAAPEHVLFISGEGLTLRWPASSHHGQRLDWQPGTLVVEQEGWFHQHFNTSNERVRYLAIRYRGPETPEVELIAHDHDDHDHDHGDHDHGEHDHDHGHAEHDHDHARDEHDHDHGDHDHDEHGHDHEHDDELAPITGDTYIDYDEEDPSIRALFEEELLKKHIPSEMDRLLARWKEYVARMEAQEAAKQRQ